ncbi:exocyst complex component 8-like protein [Dermatophagoides farinae]|uniref:Exocyst complex component 8 n=1 Tax=Dermatophagoides farinae TaxID=6954 RepID=A0A9D4NT11_DERFA|nr:exocyst complex component 8-like [Dermatophagoides farinae]KAH7638456.1 exocyst complex component 8-like protein [Dermatophagoides farinae]
MGEYTGYSSSINQIKKDPMLYICELTTKSSVTLEELLNARKTVQNCADETNTQLKKNVYKNYQLFIDTSQEISYLKSEMSQLSSYLNDEYKLLESLLSISIGGSKTGLTLSEKKEAQEKVKEERERKMLQMSQAATINGPLPTKEFRTLMEYIDGGTGLLDNRQNSLVYCDGEVIELDENYSELQNLHLVLLNDALIISTLAIDRSTMPMRKYKLQSIIDLESIAIVNVKDRRYNKFEMAFKILMGTPDDKVFLTNSPAKKKTWIDAFEAAKKYLRLQRHNQLYNISSSTSSPSSFNNPIILDTTKATNYSNLIMSPTTTTMTTTTTTTTTTMMNNASKSTPLTFTATKSYEESNEIMEENDHEMDAELPTWLIELPDDLDVYIAQRNFDEAVKLVTRAHEHFYLYPKWCDNQMHVDLKLKIDNKISELVEALSSELNVAADRSLQTGPRASRRAVALLVQLGKSSLAIRLFLDQRKRLLKYYFKQQKITDGATISFMKRMTNLFFSHFIKTSKEFLRAFDIDQSDCYLYEQESSNNSSLNWLEQNHHQNHGNEEFLINSSKSLSTSYSHTALACLNSWIYDEFQRYLALFPRHVFINQVNTLAAVECVSLAMNQCTKLRQTIGIDLLFVLNKTLKNDIKNLIDEIHNKFMEAIKLRANENAMEPLSFESKIKLNKFLSEMDEHDLDVRELIVHTNDHYQLMLSYNTCSYAKSYLNTLKDLLKLMHDPYSIRTINKILVKSFQWQMNYLRDLLHNNHNHNGNGNDDNDDDDQFNQDEFIRKNIVFILDKFVPIVIEKYCETLQVRSFNQIQTASLQYSQLKEEKNSILTSLTPDYNDDDDDDDVGENQSINRYLSPTPTPRTRKSRTVSQHQNSYRGSSVSPSSQSPTSTNNTATYL